MYLIRHNAMGDGLTGDGFGNGFGAGYGDGNGDGYGDGNGHGDGYGYGYNSGNGRGYGHDHDIPDSSSFTAEHLICLMAIRHNLTIVRQQPQLGETP